jgi:dinuclear metal center YbgI/SA1388 family protein
MDQAVSSSGAPGADTRTLSQHLEQLLQASRFSDYCPNGLQVEGKPVIKRLASAVTASLAVVREAARWGADALIVHHGWFWRGEDSRVIGVRRARLSELMAAQINLFAYHLPLDVHPSLGNNAQLALRLGWTVTRTSGEHGLVNHTELPEPLSVAALQQKLTERLDHVPLIVGDCAQPIRRLAWCTGAAQDFLEHAISEGAQAFVSGEVSERTTHLAREAGVAYFAAGHHATERFGVQALAQALAGQFGLSHRFIDDPNPV